METRFDEQSSKTSVESVSIILPKPGPSLNKSSPRILNFKPAMNRRGHLLMAALTWTVVGIVLSIVGVRWILQSDQGLRWLLLSVAILLGLGKGIFVLRRSARRIVDRIIQRGDGRCIGGFLSWKTWLLVLVMMVSGRLLRGSDLPLWFIGTLYAGIGLALASSSVTAWNALRTLERELEAPMP